MPIPTYDQFIEPVLRHLAAHPEGSRARNVYEAAADTLHLSEADRKLSFPVDPKPSTKTGLAGLMTVSNEQATLLALGGDIGNSPPPGTNLPAATSSPSLDPCDPAKTKKYFLTNPSSPMATLPTES